jgi:hypothetical protein
LFFPAKKIKNFAHIIIEELKSLRDTNQSITVDKSMIFDYLAPYNYGQGMTVMTLSLIKIGWNFSSEYADLVRQVVHIRTQFGVYLMMQRFQPQ